MKKYICPNCLEVAFAYSGKFEYGEPITEDNIEWGDGTKAKSGDEMDCPYCGAEIIDLSIDRFV